MFQSPSHDLNVLRGYTGAVDSSEVSWAQVVVLALIQGVTEFLPVSSSAHLVLPSALTDWPDQGLAFDVAVHCGTLVAVLCYFRRDLRGFAGALRPGRGGAAASAERDADLHLLAKIALATVPVALAGFAFAPLVEAHLRGIGVIAATTIAFGLALWWADRRRGRDPAPGAPTYLQALLIGLAQAVAIVPGASRSGVTLAAALALGLSRAAAARFAFLLAIPAIAGAAILMVPQSAGRAVPWPMLAVGFAVAAGSAFCCITAFVRFMERTGMTPYVIYRVVLGLVLLTFL